MNSMPENTPDKDSEAQPSAKQGVPSPADLVSDVLREARDVLSAADQLGNGLTAPGGASAENESQESPSPSVPSEEAPRTPNLARPQTIGDEQAEIRAAEQDAREVIEAEIRAEAAAPLRSVASSVEAISPQPLGMDQLVPENEMEVHALHMEHVQQLTEEEQRLEDRFAELDDLHGNTAQDTAVNRTEDEHAVPEWQPETANDHAREYGESVDVLEEFSVIADNGVSERSVGRRMMDVAAVTLACWVPIAWAFAVFVPKESPANGPSLSELIESAPAVPGMNTADDDEEPAELSTSS